MVAPLLRILVLGEFGQRKCREEGKEKEEDGAKRASENDAPEGGGGICGEKGREANHTLEVLRSLPPFSDGCSF